MNNKEIKLEAAGAGVRQWQIAECLGMADSALSRKFRKELPDEEKAQIRRIIAELSRKEV